AEATRRLAAGHYSTRVAVHGNDELARLGRDFNRLAQALERNEELRRRFMADVSHELRTPLAVAFGELEALEDGVRPLTRESLASLRSELAALGKLVDDLNQLALADLGALAYRKSTLDVVPLIERSLESYRVRVAVRRHDARVAIDFEDSAPGVPPESLPHLFERFYRVEGSRNRANGGAGLGLAICRSIAAAHGGEIAAAPSALGGLHVSVTLPVAQ